MKRIIMSIAIATSLVVPTAALACEGDSHQAKAAAPVKATVAEVAEWQKAKKVTPVDANTPETREKYGIIPGAVMLTSSSSFEAKELPADKNAKLVFYCSNDRCTSSDAAAKRAIENGYTNVAVLPDGIQGWKKAGQPLAKPQS